MSVAKVIEITAQSTKSFEDAVAQGIERSSRTVKKIQGAWVKELKVDVENGKVSMYRVILKVTFVLED
jgi:dodecin